MTPSTANNTADEMTNQNRAATGPTLFNLTSHLPPDIIRRGMDSIRWSSVYLAALKISVQVGIDSKIILKSITYTKTRRCNGSAKAALIKALSQSTVLIIKPKSPNFLAWVSLQTWDILPERQAWGVLSRNVYKMLEKMISYMLTYLRNYSGIKKSVRVSLRTYPGGEIYLYHRGISARLTCAASLHVRRSRFSIPEWSPPIVPIVMPHKHVDHYAQEMAYLLSLAQQHFLLPGTEEDVYQPYLLTIRGSKISIVTADIDSGYLESVDNIEVREGGLEVSVSQEFDMAVKEDRVNFVSVLEDMIIGLIARDYDQQKVNKERREDIKRQRSKGGDKQEDKQEDKDEGTEGDDKGGGDGSKKEEKKHKLDKIPSGCQCVF